jgi:uncharacterized membrane protein SpoIIM required for sporulation
MSELRLKSHQFRAEREADWRRLEYLLGKASKGLGRLGRDELLEIPLLYSQALSSLSVARAISLDQGLLDYLENLAARAYFFVYGPRGRLGEGLIAFFAHDWPAAVRSLWRETIISVGLTVLGAVGAFVVVQRNPGFYFALVPRSSAQGRDPSATAAFLSDTIYHKETLTEGLSVMATFLFTHNSQVAIFALALGFVFCLPAAGLMLFNGAMLGAMLALFAGKGLGVGFLGWISIHGTTELFACCLAGAGGLSMGWAVGFPGQQSRIAAATQAGRRAGVILAGVVVMLIVAALLEGFARQLIGVDALRYAVGGAMLALWCAYFYWPRGLRP